MQVQREKVELANDSLPAYYYPSTGIINPSFHRWTPRDPEQVTWPTWTEDERCWRKVFSLSAHIKFFQANRHYSTYNVLLQYACMCDGFTLVCVCYLWGPSKWNAIFSTVPAWFLIPRRPLECSLFGQIKVVSCLSLLPEYKFCNAMLTHYWWCDPNQRGEKESQECPKNGWLNEGESESDIRYPKDCLCAFWRRNCSRFRSAEYVAVEQC